MNTLSAMAIAIGSLASLASLAASAATPPLPEEVTIIGTRVEARALPGSAWVIDSQDIEVFQYTDINRVLVQAPGVYAVEEEGLGLRPNIGIRGSGTERSGKITVMEDGVLVAPAPYADPAAYYFPTTGRLAGIEILKGVPLLGEGPFTVGGAINLLATPVPNEFGGRLTAETGSHAEQRLHAHVGDSGDTWGWLLETHQWRSDGFQTIDRSSQDTGLRKQDYIARLRLNTPADHQGRAQQLDLKLGYADEQSNASYLGLTDTDFAGSSRRRYGLTEPDRMDNDWRGGHITYGIALNDTLNWRTTAYYNRFERNWYKVDHIGGSSIASVIDNANLGDTTAIGRLQGTMDTTVDVKNNAREYTAKGIQSQLEWELVAGGIAHSVELGARWHRDDIDRFQPVDRFEQFQGALVYQATTQPAGSDNREESARAQAYWLLDTVSLNDGVDLTLALRYEDIDTARIEYATPDRTVLAPANRQLSNTSREWLPGAGITWQLNERWQWLAGVHRGMAPAGAGATDGTDSEVSINYETGVRYGEGALNAELIAFYSDYENAARNCSVAFPCANNADSGTEQLGEARIQGIEWALELRPARAGLYWPLRLSYTYTDAEITRNSDDGAVLKGDIYPYIPRNQLFLGAGVESDAGWAINAAGRFISSMCIDFECNRPGSDNTFRKTDSTFVVDLASSYALTDAARVYARLDNVFDSEDIVSRSPAGARPGKPRTLLVGFSVDY